MQDIMQWIKKCTALLLALMLLVSAAPVSVLAEVLDAEEKALEEAAEEEPAAEILLPDELIVGSPTVMNGDFFTEMFGNDTADIDIRSLIHGYNLVNWDQNQGVYVFDPSVVTNIQVVQDENGNRTYFLALARDLYFSDGTPITAWNYAFSLLLMMAPEMEEIGAKIYRSEHILGYRQYITKSFRSLTGVEVLSDYQLVITLDADFLPFFYEIGLFLCVPYPIHVIAPGCRVYDEGYGVYIGNEDPTVTEPIFTADLLRETILDPETGYNSHPSVTSGPYRLTSFDGETARLELNPYYKGSWVADMSELLGEEDGDEENTEELPGEEAPAELSENYVSVFDDDGNIAYYMIRPMIEHIAFTCVDSDDVPRLFADEELHLVNKLVYGPVITEMMQNTEALSVRPQNYPRLGMTLLTFSYDRPAVHEKEVRQAIAWCLDRDALTQEYCQGYGQRVDGYYGIEKWEYMLVNQRIDPPVQLLEAGQTVPENQRAFENLYAASDGEYDDMMATWRALNLDNLTQYTVDVGEAVRLLNLAGWTLNREGDDYRPGVDDVRCKLVEGELVALDLTMMYPEGNHIVDTMQENFINYLNAAGILLTLVPMPMEDLLDCYYRRAERTTDMIYLGTNFHVVVDPSITYSADKSADHFLWNNTFSDDEELYQLAVNMRKTQPGDLYSYIVKWIAFQERYNEVLPAIPIYSNIYFDFCVDYLQNYQISAHVTWGQTITEAYFGLPEEDREEEWAGEDEFDENEDSDLVEFDD